MFLMWDLAFIFSVVETDGDADYTKAAAQLDSAKPRRIADNKQLHLKTRQMLRLLLQGNVTLMLHLIKALSEHDPSDFNGETAEIPGYSVLGFFFYVALFFMVFNA